ncbi:hypothetical protein GY45DRAFT_1315268 [Cubamyces sp. BRFM 1775]|nr:hypothetical protein GY45DRAFT_1315268 [Cubamyces sp. BRFM 1775]
MNARTSMLYEQTHLRQYRRAIDSDPRAIPRDAALATWRHRFATLAAFGAAH